MFTPAELVLMEVATATGLSEGDLHRHALVLAAGPPARTRFLREQLAAGATTLFRACQILEAAQDLPDEALEPLARGVLAPTRDGAGLTQTLFRRRLHRHVLAADPAAAAARRRRARRRIGASTQVHDDGTATLCLTHDTERVTAVMDRADAAARAARAAGDPRTLDRLRADYLCDTALNGHPGPGGTFPALGARPPATAWIVVPASTALGLDEAPCELPGHGWVSAEHARQIITAEGSIWKTLLADPHTGTAVGLTHTGYAPPGR